MAWLLKNRPSQWQVLYLLLVCVSDLICENIRYSIPEELEVGAVVGNIASHLGLHAKYLLQRRFQILSDSKRQHIDVNINTGNLFIKEKIDREQLCEQSLTCVLILEAVLEDPLTLYRVEIEILDVNDNAPVFLRSEINLEISEITVAGTSFPLQSALDPDAGTNGVRFYKLNPNEHFALKFLPGGEQNGTPELVLERALDREQQAVHQLTLTASDDGNPQKVGTSHIKITVVDVNDNAPVCQPNVQQVSVAENVPPNTSVVKVTAVDLDEGLSGELIYSFNVHTPEKVRKVFSLDSLTGEMTVIGNVDFEETEMYQISVQAKDRGSNPLLAYCKVVVLVTDVNDNSPEMMLTTMAGTVAENIGTHTTIALLRVSDRDSENSADIFCGITKGIPFKLNKLNSYYTLVTDGELDREMVPEYNITIICTDSGSPPLSTSKTLHVLVTDINDNAPGFTQPSFTVYVKENNAVGASIGSASAIDPDSKENGQIKFLILDKLINGLPASTFVSINAASGVIFAERSFDFEQLKRINLHVQAVDAGIPPLCNNVTVNVIILDQNDNPPLIVSPVPNKGTGIEDTIPRSADSGYLIAKVMATDPDSSQNAQLSYQLTQPTDDSLFTVSPNTGEIWTIRRFRHKDPAKQKLVVVVKDKGTPPLSSTVTITVLVQDDYAENASNLDRDEMPGQWQYDMKFYLIIAFGSASFAFLVAITILGIMVQKGRTQKSKSCCCWDISNFSRRSSLQGIQKASVNLQVPVNYADVYQRETLSKPFRYEVCSDPAIKDFMLLKYHDTSTPWISNTNGPHPSDKHILSASSTNKDPTEFNEVSSINRRLNV